MVRLPLVQVPDAAAVSGSPAKKFKVQEPTPVCDFYLLDKSFAVSVTLWGEPRVAGTVH